MKIKKYSLALCLLWLFGWLWAAPLSGNNPEPEREFAKKINREFRIAPTGTTALYNKYGNVKVNTWANPLVKLEITILVNAPDQRTADRILERIQVNFLNTADYVKVETVIEPEERSRSRVFSIRTTDFQIHYDVWLPADNSLDVKNRYGDAYVSNLKGKLMADIRYGALRGENLRGDADVSIHYGKISLNQVHNLTGYLSYADLLADRAEEISLDTRYSDIRIRQAERVSLTSKYDKLNFGEVSTLRLQARYGDLGGQQVNSLFITGQYMNLRLERVIETLDADLSYGKIDIRSLGRQFSQARVQARYTDVKIAVESGAAFRLDAEAKRTAVHTPHLLHYTRMETLEGQVKVSGFVGDARAPRVILARLQYGDFVLK